MIGLFSVKFTHKDEFGFNAQETNRENFMPIKGQRVILIEKEWYIHV